MKKLTRVVLISTVMVVPVKAEMKGVEANGALFLAKKKLEKLIGSPIPIAAPWKEVPLPPVELSLESQTLTLELPATPTSPVPPNSGVTMLVMLDSEDSPIVTASADSTLIAPSLAEADPELPLAETVISAAAFQLAAVETPDPADFQPAVTALVVTVAPKVEGVLPLNPPSPELVNVNVAPNEVSIATPSALVPELPVLKKVRVRLTFYSGKDDQWGSRVAWRKVAQAKRGRTLVAADPTIFPYGTWIDIPGFGKHRVEDTGSAVKTRKASGGKDPVIDIYVSEESEVTRLAHSTPEYVEITLL